MNIGYIFQDHYPWDIRVDKITRSLSKKHKVFIISRNRNRSDLVEEIDNNLFILRIYKGITTLDGFIANFPAFFSPFWLFKVFYYCKKYNIDIIIIRDLPLAPLAVLIGKLIRLPVVMDMAENYPAMIEDTWRNGKVKVLDYLIRNPKFLKYIEKKVIRFFDAIIVVSIESKKRVLSFLKKDIPFYVISNTPLLKKSNNKNNPISNKLIDGEKIKIIYVGGLEYSRGVEKVVDVFIEFTKELEDYQFVVIGDGESRDYLQKKVIEYKISKKVLFLGWIPQKFIYDYIDLCDIGIIPHLLSDHINTTIPNKIFDYMVQKKAVIVSSAPPLVRIIKEGSCGRCYDPDKMESLKDAIIYFGNEKVRKIMGENGYNAVINKYNWGQEETVLLRLFDDFSALNKK